MKSESNGDMKRADNVPRLLVLATLSCLASHSGNLTIGSIGFLLAALLYAGPNANAGALIFRNSASG